MAHKITIQPGDVWTCEQAVLETPDDRPSCSVIGCDIEGRDAPSPLLEQAGAREAGSSMPHLSYIKYVHRVLWSVFVTKLFHTPNGADQKIAGQHSIAAISRLD